MKDPLIKPRKYRWAVEVANEHFFCLFFCKSRREVDLLVKMRADPKERVRFEIHRRSGPNAWQYLYMVSPGTFNIQKRDLKGSGFNEPLTYALQRSPQGRLCLTMPKEDTMRSLPVIDPDKFKVYQEVEQ